MLVEFDPNKDRANRLKHGLALAEAALMQVETALIIPDERSAYGEVRYLMYGFIAGRLHAMVFTPRGEATRVISLRRANAREVRVYEQR